jgi:hypothetical protein
MAAVDLTIDEIATRLASAATNDFAHLQAANKCLGIVMAGWDSEPFVVIVSNYLEVFTHTFAHSIRAQSSATWLETFDQPRTPSCSQFPQNRLPPGLAS